VDTTTRAKLIAEFAYENINEPLASDFFDYNDLGVPLAIALSNDLCSITDKGVVVIEETYNNVCDEMEVPNDIDYDDINDMHDKYRELHRPE
jgi:hypothetical protein